MPEDHNAQFEEDDSRKVYVSRLPLQWGEQHLAEHFSACFGPVESASVSYDRTNECSRGYGFVTFEKEEDKETAVAQGSLHAKKRNIQIKAVVREENVLGRGRDTGVCYMWQRYSCVKGNDCRFLHEGEGSCITVSAQGEGKKKCLSFKSKGKCSKGDACPFIHDRGSKAKAAAVSEKRTSAPDDFKKICHSFKKKGKCRKGESCIFSHDFGGDGEVKEKTSEKRRMDGSFLVEARKKQKLEDPSSF